ncbi:hypothetical protein SLA2020_154710 [Shorea laevis]
MMSLLLWMLWFERKLLHVVAGREVLIDEMKVVDGVMWSGNFSNVERKGDVGLSLAIVEKMKWEVERFGWENSGENGEERIQRVEGNEVGIGKWRKFGCYVLVERFVLKRMDGSLVLTHDYRQTQLTRSKFLGFSKLYSLFCYLFSYALNKHKSDL